MAVIISLYLRFCNLLHFTKQSNNIVFSREIQNAQGPNAWNVDFYREVLATTDESFLFYILKNFKQT